jgi:hypothetical protein
MSMNWWRKSILTRSFLARRDRQRVFAPPARRKPLAVETLEERTLLSLTALLDPTSNTLRVTSDASDAIAITSTGGPNGLVKINGQDPGSGSLQAQAVDRIEILATGLFEDNVIDLSGLDPTSFINLFDVNVDGGGGNDRLVGPNVPVVWSVIDADQGNLSGDDLIGTTFHAIENLAGGTDTDVFAFLGGTITGTIAGGGGSDTLEFGGTDIARAVSLLSSDGQGFGGTVAGIGAGFTGIDDLIGSDVNDTLTGTAADGTWNLADTLTYGAGTDTLSFTGFELLQGGAGNDSFDIAGPAQGSLAVSLKGGAGNDTFSFTGTGPVTGSIDGEGGADTLSYGSFGSDVHVRVSGAPSSNGYDGTETSITGGFRGIETLQGTNNTASSLTGLDVDGTWSLGDTETYTPGTGSPLTFSGFDVLQGGSAVDTFNLTADVTLSLKGGGGADTFAFGSGARLGGTFAGQGGSDTLDFGPFGVGVSLVLTGSDAEGFGGGGNASDGFTGIDHLVGSNNGSDTLTGRDVASTWTAGTSPSYQASSGPETLTFAGFETLQGGSADDVFNIAGTATGALKGGAGADSFNFTGGFTGTIDGETGANTLSASGDASINADVSGIAATSVSNGTLIVNGAQPDNPVTVQTGGILGGTGEVGAITVNTGGTVNPGPGTGPLTANGNLNLAAGSTFAVDLAPGTSDQVAVNGTVTVAGALNVAIAAALAEGDSFIIIDNDGFDDLVSGTFTGLPQGTIFFTAGGTPLQITYTGGDGNDVVLTRPPRVDSSVQLAQSVPTPVFGQPFTVTATITGVQGIIPTGSVTFTIDSGTPVDVTLDASGQATLSDPSLSALSAGAHTITATYNGDGLLKPSLLQTLPATIGKAGTSILPTPITAAVFGQPLTLTAVVTPLAPGGGTPTGEVIFREGSTELGRAPVNASGQASVPISALGVGDHTITADFESDNGNFNDTTAPDFIQTVGPAATMTTVGSSSVSANLGEAITLTATVTVTAPGAGTPTGEVTFWDITDFVVDVPEGGSPIGAGIDLGTVLGVGSLINGTATLTIAALPGGTREIVAGFRTLGDNNFNGSTSQILNQTVNPGSTTTDLTASSNTGTFGQPVTFTVTVTPGVSGFGAPAGTVTFRDGSVDLQTLPLNNGSVTFTTSGLGAGSHNITAVYAGDTNFSGSTSLAVAQDIAKADSSATLVTSAGSSVFGEPLTLTATVGILGSGMGTPTGEVVFREGTTELARRDVDASGKATLTISTLGVGSHTITAEYVGDGNLNGSVSLAAAQTVGKAATTVAVVSSLATPTLGQAITLTATILVTSPGGGSPSGTVLFRDGGRDLGMATLTAGTATLTTTDLGVGSHTVTAEYTGDVSFVSGTSAALTQIVGQAATTAGLTGSAGTLNPGEAVTFTATVTHGVSGAGAATGTVTFLDGTTVLGTAALDGSGQATFTIATLGIGSHTISAVYGGEERFTASTSAELALTVNNPVQTPDGFVAQLYRDVLGREGEAAGLGFWNRLLDEGASRAEIVLGFLTSLEYRTNLVQGLYRDLLGREADAAGLNSFVDRLAAGATVEQVKALILGSAEYFQNRGGGSEAGFLLALYQDVLGRAIDRVGEASFSLLLAFGRTRATIATLVLNSEEARQILVEDYYQQYLQRTADQAGRDGWVSRLLSGARDEHVLAGIIGSEEYFGRV